MSRAAVLVVDDERGIADLFSAWLEAEYDVRTAYGGESALEQVGPETDVVLLDRRMPQVSGDQVLEEIRTRELPCHVAMVTAVEPDVDIVEMGFDDYVVKPVDRATLVETVERMLAFGDLGPGAKAYYAGVSKRTVLEDQKQATDLEASPEYANLNAGIETYGGMITALAEDAIKANTRESLAGAPTGARVELRDWERKLEDLDEADPLYQVAMERVEELRSAVDGGADASQEQFLEAVAEGFIAEGLWLDARVRRALNLLIYNRDREKFIINRQAISDLASQGATEKFEVSQEVRDLARKELGTRR